MFLVTIAIIAAIVIIYMAVATFVLWRSENKIDTQTPPDDEPNPPVEVTVAPPPKESPEEALPSISPVEDVAASSPQEIPEHDLPAIPAIAIAAAPPPAELISRSTILAVAIGFLGWFVSNTFLWIWVLEGESGVLWNPMRLIPLCVNIPALLALSLAGRRILLGVFLGILVNAIGTLLFTAPGPFEDDRVFDIIAMTPFFLSFFYPGL